MSLKPRDSSVSTLCVNGPQLYAFCNDLSAVYLAEWFTGRNLKGRIYNRMVDYELQTVMCRDKYLIEYYALFKKYFTA